MIITKLVSIFLIAFVSPLWPIGQNPIIGDPFIIVNKQTNELAFIVDGHIESVYPVATGKDDQLTPEGKFTVTVKANNPYYRKKNIEGGAKENPLGSRWIGFNAKETDGRTYGVHGNNNPVSIGQYITAGCIRMYEKDVQALYERIPIGTNIVIVKSDKSFEELGKESGALG